MLKALTKYIYHKKS